jgi:hypothetical protein
MVAYDLIDVGEAQEPSKEEENELVLDLILALIDKHDLTIAGLERWPTSSSCSTGCARRRSLSEFALRSLPEDAGQLLARWATCNFTNRC